jgi:hypothetical protein
MVIGKGRAWGFVVLVLWTLTACSENGVPTDGDAASTSPDSTSRAPSTPGGESPSAALTTPRFQTPSGKILCESSASSFLCVTDYRLNPEPPADFCPVDWIGVFIEVGAYAGPACSGDPGISRDPATRLEYGQTWARTGVTCLSENTGLTCRDENGNGFTLAMAGWSILGKEEAATAAFNDLRRAVRAQARDDLPGQVARVDAPVLRAGEDCGELQQAFVPGTLSDDRPVIYEACYVSGTWHITDGPLFPD